MKMTRIMLISLLVKPVNSHDKDRKESLHVWQEKNKLEANLDEIMNICFSQCEVEPT